MTFCIVGLITWAYVLLGEVKHAGHMLLLTIAPVMIILLIWQQAGGKPGKTAKCILGQIIVVGVFNAVLMMLLGGLRPYVGIPLHLFLLVCVIWSRLAKHMAPKKPSAYERGYQDGAFAQRR